MKTKTNNLTTKRFVIRKSLIGKNTIITFVNKKKETKKDLITWNVSRNIKVIHQVITYQHSVDNTECLVTQSAKALVYSTEE